MQSSLTKRTSLICTLGLLSACVGAVDSPSPDTRPLEENAPTNREEASGSTLECTAVCDHADALCGVSDRSACIDECGRVSSRTRSCVLQSQDCDAASACFEEDFEEEDEPESLPPNEAPGDCAGSYQNVEFSLARGENTRCTPDSDTVCHDEGFVIACGADGISVSDCEITPAAECGSCTTSADCGCFKANVGGGPVSVGAGCFDGVCRMRCNPSSAGCSCVAATPDDNGDARGYCIDDGC